MYNCSFTTHLLILLRGMIREVIELLPTSNAIIDNSPLSHIYHLVMTHLDVQDARIEERLAALMDVEVEDYKERLLILCLVGLAVAVVFLGILLHFLMKRLPPQAIVANPELLDYLMWRNAKHSRHGMTAAQNV